VITATHIKTMLKFQLIYKIISRNICSLLYMKTTAFTTNVKSVNSITDQIIGTSQSLYMHTYNNCYTNIATVIL